MNITLKLITSLAKWHLINTPKGWGNGWQIAIWAYSVGLGLASMESFRRPY